MFLSNDLFNSQYDYIVFFLSSFRAYESGAYDDDENELIPLRKAGMFQILFYLATLSFFFLQWSSSEGWQVEQV